MKYEPQGFESKWQQTWRDSGAFRTDAHPERENFYALIEFPYPSGFGLHVGHARPYTGMDALARARRMQGYNVLFPIGYDAFGLPTENFAIANKIHPAEVTKNNISVFRNQVVSLGYSFDLDREVNTDRKSVV